MDTGSDSLDRVWICVTETVIRSDWFSKFLTEGNIRDSEDTSLVLFQHGGPNDHGFFLDNIFPFPERIGKT